MKLMSSLFAEIPFLHQKALSADELQGSASRTTLAAKISEEELE